MAIKIDDQANERDLTTEERKAKGGMWLSSTMGFEATAASSLVDVCKTPAPPGGPIPIPYPIVTSDPRATKTKPKSA